MTVAEWRKACQKPASFQADWTERAVRIVSIYFTIVLVKLRVSANQLSIANAGVAILAGTLYAIDIRLAPFAFLAQILNQIWDSSDGEIARYHKRPSLTGLYADRLGTWYLYPALLLGLGIGLSREMDALWPVVLGALASVAMLQGRLAFFTAYFCTMDAILYHKQVDPRFATMDIGDGRNERDLIESSLRSGVLRIPYWFADFLFTRGMGFNIVMLVAMLGVITGILAVPSLVVIVYGICGPLAAATTAGLIIRQRKPDIIYYEVARKFHEQQSEKDMAPRNR